MASNFTEHFQLNQWEPGDQVKREGFNADNVKIDAALGALTAQMATRGNCQVVTGQYTGTGTYGEANPTVFTFDKPPLALFITGYAIVFTVRNASRALYLAGGTAQTCSASWEGNTVSLYSKEASGYQVNQANYIYTYVAFLEA